MDGSRLVKAAATKLLHYATPEQRRVVADSYLFLQTVADAVKTRRPLYRSISLTWLAPEIADLESSFRIGPGPNEVLVETIATAVSPGTEGAAFVGLPGASRGFPYIPGYSGIGRVMRAGKNVTGIAVGQRVAGRLKHSSMNVLAADTLFKCPQNVSDYGAASLELGIIALQGVRKAATAPGEAAIVLGCGIIGQLAIRLLRISGACPIYAVASSKARAANALEGGADLFFTVEEAAAKTVQVPLVVDASGASDGIETSIRHCRPGGRIVLLSSQRSLSRPLALSSIVSKTGIRIVGAHISSLPSADSSGGLWTYKDEGVFWLTLLEQKRIEISSLLSHELLPSGLPAFYRELTAGKTKPVLACVKWS